MPRLTTVLEQLEKESYLSENIKLDFPTLQSGHEKADDYGNNVSPDMEAMFREKISHIHETVDLIRPLTLAAFHLCSN